MRAFSTSLVAVLLLAATASAGEHVLPVFALNIPGPGNSLWASEVYVTNLSGESVVVHEGSLIRGASDDGVPCLPLVQPFLDVAPHGTKRWSPSALALGIGCPAWARGGLTFWTDGDVMITSRMVNLRSGVPRDDELLRGFSQEIRAVRVEDLPRAGDELLLPAVAWHPNSCGPRAFDTNLFLTNPGDSPVTIELRLSPDELGGLVVDGTPIESPWHLVVPPRSHEFHRVAGPDSMLDVCMNPVVSAFAITLDGPVSIIGSVIDRSTQDARTVTPIRIDR